MAVITDRMSVSEMIQWYCEKMKRKPPKVVTVELSMQVFAFAESEWYCWDEAAGQWVYRVSDLGFC